MSTLSWVIGRGGLLGSSVERAISTSTFRPDELIAWQDRTRLHDQIVSTVAAFRMRLESNQFSDCSVYWCAGAGVIGTSTEDLAAETAALRFFLDQLGYALECLPEISARVFLASSAGGVHGGSSDRPITETTPPNPMSPYGWAKLEQENVLRDWVHAHPHVSTLIGRLSNLYGPGQRLDKPQGLISHMSRCVLFNVPVRIYVSLDTIRDYLYAEDAGTLIAAGMRRLCPVGSDAPQHLIKLYASEKETTIAALIGLFRDIAKRHLRLVNVRSPAGAQQPAKLHFRSAIWTDQRFLLRTELLDGIHRVYQHQLMLLQAGRLPKPIS